MNQKQEVILRHYREGQSKKAISRDLGLDIKTVRRYLLEHEEQRRDLNTTEGEQAEALLRALTQGPKYDSSNRFGQRLTEEVREKIDGYLSENARKRVSGRHKQVMKKIDIHEALLRSGYQIGYTTVCNYVREREQQGREAYIRQHYDPGQVCEFDWGEVKLTIGGEGRTYQLAVFTAAYSNYRWAKLFERQDTASFQEAHAVFFTHIEGVYYQLVYDNTRVVIRRFVGRQEKEPTEGLLSLSLYYHFGFRFCNVGRGNEKGHVERSVEYVRRKVFGERDSFASRSEADAYLQGRSEELNARPPSGGDKSAEALLTEERAYLYACPPAAFECADWRSLRVDKYSTVNVGNNNYSAPEAYVGKIVDVKVSPSKLVMYEQRQEICRHERQYTNHGWYIQLDHYLTTLARKPGALAGSVALRQADERLRRIHQDFFGDRPKAFIELLHYQREQQVSLDKLEAVLASLRRITPQDISLDKIRVLCERREIAPAGLAKPDAIAEYAQAQLLATAQLLPQADSLSTQIQAL